MSQAGQVASESGLAGSLWQTSINLKDPNLGFKLTAIHLPGLSEPARPPAGKCQPDSRTRGECQCCQCPTGGPGGAGPLAPQCQPECHCDLELEFGRVIILHCHPEAILKSSPAAGTESHSRRAVAPPPP